MARVAANIDWTQPWFQPYREPGECVAQRWEDSAHLHRALASQHGAPLAFVSQDQLPAGEPYESFILRTRLCPTRDNLHDFFNGLVWLTFPLSKSRFNQLQSEQIEAGARNLRGPVRDAITVFDENGALLHAPQPIWDALRARDWLRLFIDLRPLWAQARLVIFGHALLEKLVTPRKPLTAHVWRVASPESIASNMDAWLAAQLEPDVLATKPFTPLPVMGIPGWCAENQNFSFYDDSLVFRPGRRHNDMTTSPPTALCP
ncbi:DUF3025 domain-containing protein [Caenimonas sp. SL110]|uniref:DUF3025 domain-containing protein n=1 Tax=Caenimonas sp. SL110 TaxID=1450524 RepID=UPI000652C943|nr:DUF3025 domain-containing protein [Caenimonas sp. SL110]